MRAKKLWTVGIAAFVIAVPVGIVAANAAGGGGNASKSVFVGTKHGQSHDPPGNLVPDPAFPDDKTPVMSSETADQWKRALKDAQERGPSVGYIILPSHIDQHAYDVECGDDSPVSDETGVDRKLDCEAYRLINDGTLEPGSYASHDDLETAVEQAENSK